MVVVVAVIGIVIVRFGQASRAYTNAYPDTVNGFTSMAGGITILNLRSSGNWVQSSDVPYTRWFPNTHVKQTCADIVAKDSKRPFAVGTQVEVREYAPTGGDLTWCP